MIHQGIARLPEESFLCFHLSFKMEITRDNDQTNYSYRSLLFNAESKSVTNRKN